MIKQILQLIKKNVIVKLIIVNLAYPVVTFFYSPGSLTNKSYTNKLTNKILILDKLFKNFTIERTVYQL